MRNLLFLLIVAAGVVWPAGDSRAQVADGSRLTPEQFAILPWGQTPGDPQVLQAIHECGFNLAGFVEPEHLDRVAAAQLRCIVLDREQHACDPDDPWDPPRIRRHVEALVARVGTHKAVYGYFVNDEPAARFHNELQAWVDAYRLLAPQAVAYVNLFASNATPRQLGVTGYTEYLESYLQTVQPTVLSYDHYALMADGTLREGYFYNLEVIREAAQRYDIPFWNTVLSNAHYGFAEPTDAGLRFQLYTSLAYGARGISYFTYFTPNIGNYRLGPIDQFGRKTPTWDMLRNVNMQMHRIGGTYAGLRSVGVFHHPEVPAGSVGIEQARWVEDVSGGSMVVGEFEGPQGQPFVLVVNKSLQRSAAMEIRFREPGRIRFVSPYTGQLDLWAPDNHWLAPGQGLLLSVQKQ